MSVKMIVLLAMLLSAPSLSMSMAASPEHTGQGTHVVIGTLEELDMSKMSGKIKTGLGQTVVFKITRPGVLTHKSKS